LLNGWGDSKAKIKIKVTGLPTQVFRNDEIIIGFGFEVDLPPPKVCRALPAEGQFAMDGELSFVEQGCESKRPGNGVRLSIFAR
jgi:hypothetical protein